MTFIVCFGAAVLLCMLMNACEEREPWIDRFDQWLADCWRKKR